VRDFSPIRGSKVHALIELERKVLEWRRIVTRVALRVVGHEREPTRRIWGGPTHRGKHVGGYRVNRAKDVEVSSIRRCGFVRVRDRQGAS